MFDKNRIIIIEKMETPKYKYYYSSGETQILRYDITDNSIDQYETQEEAKTRDEYRKRLFWFYDNFLIKPDDPKKPEITKIEPNDSLKKTLKENLKLKQEKRFLK
jgi:hypothetical protein